MKHLALMLLSATLCACGGGGSSAPEQHTPEPPLAIDIASFQPCAAPSCSPAWVDQLSIDAWFWSSGVIHSESVMALATTDGSDPSYPLWRLPASAADVLEVRRWTDGGLLTAGVDYNVAYGGITIPTSSGVSLAPADFPFAGGAGRLKDGNPLMIGDYASHQLVVTYRPSSAPAAPQVFGTLPKLRAKLAKCEPVAITAYGDSISALGRYPYVNQVAAYIESRCPGSAHFRNRSVGGYNSTNGANNAATALNDSASDLVIIGFGMNDAGKVPVSKETYASNIRAIMTKVLARAPGTEFLLLSAGEGNDAWDNMDRSSFFAYRDALLSMTSVGVAAVDITTVWHDVIASKRSYYSVTLNGANHLNDFGVSIYAQSVLRAIGYAP